MQLRKLFVESINGTILNGLKILIADDDEYNLVVAGDTLKLKANASITTASNGKEVIALLQENDFDVILMDVQMPAMNGLEATKYIRENFSPPKKDIPIIALTASTLQADLDQCKKAGMNIALSKPFKADELITCIAQVTGLSLQATKDITSREVRTAESPAAASNLSYLRSFCEGETTRMAKYITLFLESAPVVTEKIRAAVLRNDYMEVAAQVHGYKTKWIMMGMGEAKDLALEIEQECRQQPVGGKVKEKIEKLLRQMHHAEIELKNALLQFK